LARSVEGLGEDNTPPQRRPRSARRSQPQKAAGPRANYTFNALDTASHFPTEGKGPYDSEVFGLAGRRIAEGIVALFALLGFAFVPLGKKTALEHTRDIFTTPAALAAFHEFVGAVDQLRTKLVGTLVAPPRDPEQKHSGSGPKPELPELSPKPPGRN
jgi:hypothetical protein